MWPDHYLPSDGWQSRAYSACRACFTTIIDYILGNVVLQNNKSRIRTDNSCKIHSRTMIWERVCMIQAKMASFVVMMYNKSRIINRFCCNMKAGKRDSRAICNNGRREISNCCNAVQPIRQACTHLLHRDGNDGQDETRLSDTEHMVVKSCSVAQNMRINQSFRRIGHLLCRRVCYNESTLKLSRGGRKL